MLLFLSNNLMKSLINKKSPEKNQKVAQCCAKTSKIVAGCHD
jgi:hypothetical protein